MKPKVRAIEVLIITLADIAIYIVQTIAQAITLALASATTPDPKPIPYPNPYPTPEVPHAR